MIHNIHSISDLDIAFDCIHTPEHHHPRRWINLYLSLPELPCFTIVSCTVKSKCSFVDDILGSFDEVLRVSNQFKDFYSFGFSLDGKCIKFSYKVMRCECKLGLVREDDIDSILFPCSFEAGCKIDRITENRLVESIV